jgi:hypothetical protein
MTDLPPARVRTLRRRGYALQIATLGWNVVGVVVLAVLAIGSGSVALAGFGLDSLIENRSQHGGPLGAVRER